MADSMNNSLTALAPQPKGSASLAAVLSAFVPTWVVGVSFVAIFILIRQKYPIIYAPRTYLGIIPEKDRTPSEGHAYLDWFHSMRKLPDKFLLYHESLDAYLYLRFLRTIIFICVVGCGLTWPILMPVNAMGGGSSTELDKITISNVTIKNRLYAHAVVAWVFLGFVMFTVARERFWLVGLRQAWTLSTPNAKRLSSRTVLFLSAPRDALEQENISRYFGDSAVRVWPVTKLDTLKTLVSERESLVDKLESAETVLIQKANSRKARRTIDGGEGYRPSWYDLPDLVKKAIRLRSKPLSFPFGSVFGISFMSKKEDTIQSLRDQIKEKSELIEEMRKSHTLGESSHGAAAVFVEFKAQADAQRACQQVASSNPLALMPRYTDVKPNEVIWDNLTIPPVKRVSRDGLATALVILSIIFWSIPSGFVGLVSNISYLAENFEWLQFLNRLPDPVFGLLSGLLPPLLTSLLAKDVPLLYRWIFKKFGGPTNTANELKVQKWFIVFQVTQVFLVTAVFSGAATVASQLAKHLQDPTAIPTLLATQLPKSSNYYLTYFIIQGTTTAADNLLNWTSVLAYISSEHLVDETPRQKFKRHTSMRGIAWGKVFPKFTNFAIIAIAYSCVAPLVLGFAAAGLALYYCSYRYNLFFVIQPKIDTKGQAYTLALRHLLTGVYISELVLIGFFGLRQAKGPTVMAGLLLIVTVIYNVLMDKYMAPLEKFLPAELVISAERGDAANYDSETTPLLSSAEEGRGQQATGAQSGIVPSSVAEHVIKPTTRFFDPHAFASYKSLRSWLRDGGDDYHDARRHGDDEDDLEYTEEELRRAYLHPALTAQTPIIWMAHDPMKASENELRETKECGLDASDEGAWLDEKHVVHWDAFDFERIPVWKEGTKY